MYDDSMDEPRDHRVMWHKPREAYRKTRPACRHLDVESKIFFLKKCQTQKQTADWCLRNAGGVRKIGRGWPKGTNIRFWEA